MADRTILIDVETLKIPASNPAQLDGGQEFYYALFDDTTSQSGKKQFRIPDDYVGTPRLIIQFTMADTQTGTLTVKFGVSAKAVTPDDAVDIESKSFDTVNTGTKTLANNEAEGILKELEIALTNFDSGVAGDLLQLLLALDVTGTAAGDVEAVTFTFKYADA